MSFSVKGLIAHCVLCIGRKVAMRVNDTLSSSDYFPSINQIYLLFPPFLHCLEKEYSVISKAVKQCTSATF